MASDYLLNLSGVQGESRSDPASAASGATDSEWKYVSIRRTALEEADAGGLAAAAPAVEERIGGWGSSMYQYDFPSSAPAADGGGGTYDDVVVDGRIITGDHAAFDDAKAVANEAAGTDGSGISHGVTVLAWARVDGTGDVDGDGEPDVIVGTSGGGGPVVRNADATGTQEGDVDGHDLLIWNRGGTAGAGAVGDFLAFGLVQTGDAASWPTEHHSLNFEEIKVEAVPAAAVCPNCVLGDGSVRFVTDSIDPF